MAATSVDDRLDAIEKELSELKLRLEVDKPPSTVPWWEQIFGTFANSEAYDDAMQLGREYRESLRPKDGEDVD